MRQVLYVFSGIFFLFLLAHPAAALGGEGLKVKYFLDCQDGNCTGFKVIEEPVNGSGNAYLPQVSDLSEGEGEKIFLYLQDTGRLALVDDHQQVIATMFNYCATAVMTNDNATKQTCAQYDDKSFKLTLQPTIKPLPDWRQEMENRAEASRQAYQQTRIKNSAISLGIFVLLPISLLIVAGLINDKLFLLVLLGLLILQVLGFCNIAFIGFFVGWPYIVPVVLGFILLSILLEGIYFFWYQTKQQQLRQSE